MNRARVAPAAAMAAMSILFGISFVATKIGLTGFTPAQLIFLRFAFAAGLFLAFSPWFRMGAVDRTGHLQILAMALLEPGAYFFLEALGLQRTLASTAAILINTIPLFVLLLDVLWLKARIVAYEVALIAVSLVGVSLLVLAGGIPKALGGSLLGDLFILGAALVASFYTVIAKRLLSRYSVLAVTRLQCLYGALLYLPFAAWDWWCRGLQPVSGRALGAMLYLGAGCSFLAYGLLNYSLSKAKATHVAAFTNVIPVVGTAFAVLFLHEVLYPVQIAGAVLVVCSVALLNVKGKAEPAVLG